MQSPFEPAGRGLHVAIIMDGNGRWATTRGLPRAAGHAEGARAVRRTVEEAVRLGIGTLTLYAFSGDNWKRPGSEVATLMRLFARYLRAETPRCIAESVQLSVIGRRDRIGESLAAAIERAERATAGGTRLHLRIAIDYSARDVLVRAAAEAAQRGPCTRDEFSALVGRAERGPAPARDVDLLIRTGGEQRLSDFMLWECAYAELYFTHTMWPDFDAERLRGALAEFARRERRFGDVPHTLAG